MLWIYDTLDPPVRCQMSFQPRSFGDFLVPPISRAPTGDFQVPKNLGDGTRKKNQPLRIFIYTLYHYRYLLGPNPPF